MNCPKNFSGFNLLNEDCRECFLFKDCKEGAVNFKTLTVIPSDTPDIFTATLYIQQLMGAITKNALMIGKLLKPIKDNKLYINYAEHITNWGEYLRELKISRSSADYLIRIAEVFGTLADDSLFLGIDHSRLIQALPYIKTQEDAEKWLNEAREQDLEGWRNCLRSVQGKVTSDDGHTHDWNIIAVCSICGKREKRD